jgi:ribosomal protein S20
MSTTRTTQARRHEHATGHPSTAGGPASRSTVKRSLTPNRRRRPAENDEYASFIRRILRAYARRVAAGDVDALADMTSLAAELDDVISQAVTGLHAAGYSWAEIAVRLGVTRQAAQQRGVRS